MATKLELTWIGKEEEIKIEPRILVENPSLSNLKSEKIGQTTLFDTENGTQDNLLIHGDNLLALKAIETKFAGQVKCIYIDPPYNTGAAFEHYDDNVEHSTWLNLMRARLCMLRNLLSSDGVIAVQIDAVEMAHLKVLLDEIFNRQNFINIVCCRAKIAGVSGSNMGKSLQDNMEYILLYAKDKNSVSLNPMWIKTRLFDRIKTYEIEGKSWKYTSIMTKLDGKTLIKEDTARGMKYYGYSILETMSIASFARQNGITEEDVYNKYADRIFQTTNAQSSVRQTVLNEMQGVDYQMIGLEYTPIKGKNGGNTVEILYKGEQRRMMMFLSDAVEKIDGEYYYLDKINTLWDDIQYNNLTKEGSVQFPNGKKPEALVERIIELTTQEGDLVLDSFLGSGTTAAVAHKMNRRWIGIEMGDHAYSHCKVRLDAVIQGTDEGGISLSRKWNGGGGYRFYELAPSLVVEDRFGNPIINKEYNAEMLAAAMALHEGFAYEPDTNFYWKQGKNENAYIFTTTSHITADYLASIATEMQEGEYLVIACKTYDDGLEKQFRNITIKKIPQVLLGRCEFGIENYNLNIVDVPTVDEEEN